jgi:hypothetical protein
MKTTDELMLPGNENLIDIKPYDLENFTETGYKLHAIAVHRHTAEGKVIPVHDFRSDLSSFIFMPNDYLLIELKEKVTILESMVRGKIYPDFGLTMSGWGIFPPELYLGFSLPEIFFAGQPESGTIFIGVKNFTEKELAIDANQVMGYLHIFE